MGMRTVEIIPTSLQEELTEAWNSVCELREVARTEEDKEGALKWLLWLPHGLLHEAARGDKADNHTLRRLARRFKLWRQIDMREVVSVWKMAAIKAERRL